MKDQLVHLHVWFPVNLIFSVPKGIFTCCLSRSLVCDSNIILGLITGSGSSSKVENSKSEKEYTFGVGINTKD